MIILDGSIVFVALPHIQSALGFSGAELSWVVNGYLVPFAGFMLLSGRFGDFFGRKRVFVAGLVLFTLASWLCGLSETPAMLIVFRFLQGIGGALSSSVVLGMVVHLFPEPRLQGKAIGVYSFAQAAGSSIGLVAGGLLTQGLGWQWIFFVNVPIGLAAVILAWSIIPADLRSNGKQGSDVPGAILITSGLMLAVFTIVDAPESRWGSAYTISFAALAAAILLAFAMRQAKARSPLIDLNIFRSGTILRANVTMFLTVSGLFGFQYFTTLYLQNILGMNAVQTGLAFIPAPLAIAVVSLGLSGWLNKRIGNMRVLPWGLLLIMLGLIWLSMIKINGSYAMNVLPALVLIGIGFGASVTVMMGEAMSVSNPDDSGLASGLINTTQQVGAAFGTAILAAVASGRTNSLISGGMREIPALVGGFRLAYIVSAAFVGAAIAAVVLGEAKRKRAAFQMESGSKPSR
jgi:EmrB/QacA subfamily drug resistance transporter